MTVVMVAQLEPVQEMSVPMRVNVLNDQLIIRFHMTTTIYSILI